MELCLCAIRFFFTLISIGMGKIQLGLEQVHYDDDESVRFFNTARGVMLDCNSKLSSPTSRSG